MYRLMAGTDTDINQRTNVKESFKFILHQYPNSLKNILIKANDKSSGEILFKKFKKI